MTWPFENDTSAVEKKLAGRSIRADKRRSVFVILTIALAVCLMGSLCFLYSAQQLKTLDGILGQYQAGCGGLTREEAARLAEEKAQALALAEKLKGVQVNIKARAGQGGKLFGSITNKEISEELKKQFGIDVNKSKIVLGEPIKSFGSFEVKCKLGSEVSGAINLLVIEDK